MLQAFLCIRTQRGCGLKWYHYGKGGEIVRRIMIVLFSSCVPGDIASIQEAWI